MATFRTAYQNFTYQPIDLDTADFKVLKERDPALFEAAYEA